MIGSEEDVRDNLILKTTNWFINTQILFEGQARGREKAQRTPRGWKPLPLFIHPHKAFYLSGRQYKMWERHLAAIRISRTPPLWARFHI